MLIFFTTSALFIISFLAQIITWKVRIPNQQIRALLFLFAAVFCLWLLGAIRLSIAPSALLHIALFYGSVSLCYVITYSAIEADSPTLSLIRFLAEAKGDGRSKEEIAKFMGLRPFVQARLSALTRSDLIRKEGLRYVASGPQPLSFRVILGFRKLYGPLAKGG